MSNISLSRLNPRQFQLYHQMLASFTSSCNTWKPIIMNMWQKRLKLFSRFSCELSNDLTVRNVDDPDWDLAQCELILYVGLVTRESAHLYIDVLQCNRWDGIEPVDIVVRNRRYYVLRCLPEMGARGGHRSSTTVPDRGHRRHHPLGDFPGGQASLP